MLDSLLRMPFDPSPYRASCISSCVPAPANTAKDEGLFGACRNGGSVLTVCCTLGLVEPHAAITGRTSEEGLHGGHRGENDSSLLHQARPLRHVRYSGYSSRHTRSTRSADDLPLQHERPDQEAPGKPHPCPLDTGRTRRGGSWLVQEGATRKTQAMGLGRKNRHALGTEHPRVPFMHKPLHPVALLSPLLELFLRKIEDARA